MYTAFGSNAVLDLMQPNLFQADDPATAVDASFAEIVFDRPLDHAYTYAVPFELQDQIAVGKRVLAPFGKGDRGIIGFCVGVTETKPERKVKAIAQVIDDEALLTEHLLKLTRWMAAYYLCGWGQVLNAVVPAGLRQQPWTRAFRFWPLLGSFGSRLAFWRTRQRNDDWICGPGQPKRS